MDTPDPRLVDLESKLAFLERTLELLDEVVREQDQRLEAFERRLAELGERFSKAEGEAEERDPADERPPHY